MPQLKLPFADHDRRGAWQDRRFRFEGDTIQMQMDR